MRYIIDNLHSDNILMLQNLFKNKDFIVKDFREDKDLSFLKQDDCLILSMSSIINHSNLFLNLRQKFICYTLNLLPEQSYKIIGSQKNCKGFISSSIENQRLINSLSFKSFFAPLTYPHLSKEINLNYNSNQISTFINNYKLFGEQNKHNNINSYEVFNYVKINSNTKVKLYDLTTNQSGKDTDILMNTKYYLHIKYWGHICNAPLKALALGVPVIMDTTTYFLGCYSYYLHNQFNCIILDKPEDIVKIINDSAYNNLYKNLKTNCVNFRDKIVGDYSNLLYQNFENFLNEK